MHSLDMVQDMHSLDMQQDIHSTPATHQPMRHVPKHVLTLLYLMSALVWCEGVSGVTFRDGGGWVLVTTRLFDPPLL